MWTTITVAVFLILGAACGHADEPPRRADIWSPKLDGQPPRCRQRLYRLRLRQQRRLAQLPLAGWSDYGKCRPEPNSLREVYFRYDDELEYWAKAHRARTLIAQYAGTKVLDFPVIVSGLFDEGGALAGLRIVTDPQTNPQDRKQAYTLTNF